ncbi:P-loop containing nucleoside triphosphate hydrolase protein [Fimicolochytrium jonesii]|uniref:P-loop containing nucleoside triphosphate hydrolase protein n=1 Tax=Fimicolochytrium jonesii TaxID=1396493 RepID=UPI0022FEE392|nr:P-loop containing nucleoside triphosphate hydrolase protein [Fimicolochytrium jonesii]KAI8823384.1 P-loop containing nucleoside triphosphate hydrolase protein [Fimicolochytrium jonesii]
MTKSTLHPPPLQETSQRSSASMSNAIYPSAIPPPPRHDPPPPPPGRSGRSSFQDTPTNPHHHRDSQPDRALQERQPPSSQPPTSDPTAPPPSAPTHGHTPHLSLGSLVAFDFPLDPAEHPLTSHQSSQSLHRKKASRVSLENMLPTAFRRSMSATTLKKLVVTDPIVELRNIHKTYLLGLEGVAALRGVSLSIQRGEWVAVYGTSGGGKTSLLNIIGTIDKPTKGDLTICDTVITPNTKDEVLADLRLSKLGFVFQSFNLLSSMTALENVELPMVLKGTQTASERRTRAVSSLERVGLAHRLHHFPHKLSGGEQQRVTIARAIANLPELLLLDEPTGDLDTQNTLKILHLLHTLNLTEHMTFIMVTHDVYLKNFAHRVIYMRDGKISKVKMTRSERREVALRELEVKIEELERKIQAKADQPSTQPTPFTPSLPSTHIGRVAGESDHTPGTFVSRTTEIREPGDYATYSASSGVAARISGDAVNGNAAGNAGGAFGKGGMPSSKSHQRLGGEERREGGKILKSARDLDDIV